MNSIPILNPKNKKLYWLISLDLSVVLFSFSGLSAHLRPFTEQWASQVSWRSSAQSLWCSCRHMEVTLAASILMTSDQGLLVIHLPSLHRVSMATAAGLSYPSWTHWYIPLEWCMVGRWRNTVLLLTFACIGFYKVARRHSNDSAAGNLSG